MNSKTFLEMQEKKISKDDMLLARQKVLDIVNMNMSEMDALSFFFALVVEVALKLKHKAIEERLQHEVKEFLTQTFQFIWELIVRG